MTQLVRQRRSVTGGRRHCAAPADGTGARSRSFPPAGLAGSRGLPRSPGPQVPADHLRDADVLLGRADQQDTLEFRVQAPDVSRRRSVVLPYRRCMPARNRAPPPAGRACRYARHARTWPGALATRRHNDHFGTQWKRTSDDGAADHNGGLGSPFNRSRSAADTTEPAGQAGIRTRRADSRGRALTCAAPFKWRPLTAVLGRRGHRTLVTERDGVAGSPLELGVLRGPGALPEGRRGQMARPGGCAWPTVPDGLVKITVVRPARSPSCARTG